MRRFVLMLTWPLLLAGCSGAGTGNNATLAIGGVWSLTGAAATYGVATRNGAQMAVDQANTAGTLGAGRTFRLISQDDASTTAGAQAAYNKLIAQDQVVAILGPTLSSAAVATLPTAQNNQTVAVGCTTTADGLTAAGSYVFRVALPDQVMVKNTVTVTWQRLHYHRVALLSDSADTYAKSSAASFREALGTVTASIVADETCQTGDTDFAAQLNRIIAASPEALFIATLSTEAIAILKQALQLGLPSTVAIIGGDGLNTPSLITGAAAAAEGVITGTPWISGYATTGNSAFVSAYKTLYGASPDASAALGYTSVMVLADAVSRIGLVTSGLLRDGLKHTSNLATILGIFNFDADRNGSYPPLVQVVKSGKFQLY